MTVLSGTGDTRTEHSVPWGLLGLMTSMGVPVALIVVGVAVDGWGAISWPGAIVWGVAGTFAFTLFSAMGKAVGMTRMDLLDLLGSTVVPAHTTASRVVGFVIHHSNGAVLAVAWAYGAALLACPRTGSPRSGGASS
jgi:predicted cobalt transporter CbtA